MESKKNELACKTLYVLPIITVVTRLGIFLDSLLPFTKKSPPKKGRYTAVCIEKKPYRNTFVLEFH